MNKINLYIKPSIFVALITTLLSCNAQTETTKHLSISKDLQVDSKIIGLDQKANMMYQDSVGNYWFSSKEKGVYKYDGKNLVLFTKNDGLCSYDIINIQEDSSGNIYLDAAEGVCKYNGEYFYKLEVAKSKSTDEWYAQPNDLWFSMGFQHSGPFRYDGEKLQHLPFPKNELEKDFFDQYPNASFNPYGIYLIHKDEDNTIWFGTANLGLYVFDGKEFMWQNDNNWTSRPNGMTFGVRSIAKDKNGYYWICNSKYKYKRVANDSNTKTGNLKSINLQSIQGFEEDIFFLHMQVDNEGVIWMLTWKNGVWQNDGEKLTQHFISIQGKDISPNSAYKDKKGTLWFNTTEFGIFKYSGDQFVKFEI